MIGFQETIKMECVQLQLSQEPWFQVEEEWEVKELNNILDRVYPLEKFSFYGQAKKQNCW